jgi:phosphopantothenoylcysteine decarboxylase/phosphopantothenate--cysteine ligase
LPIMKGKKIILGVTGSIAAYKSALLVREFVRRGAAVKVIMTPFAAKFIAPLTLATLSKNPVHIHYLENEKTGVWTNHVELGKWADLILIAPATANTLAKMAQGHCDNLLLATWLSATCPVWVAPAMDLDMFAHPTTQENITKLRNLQVHVLDSPAGELASGLSGEGRMEEPENISSEVEQFFENSVVLSNKKWLITAGPTYEHIDPVRYIGNHSSGKMGIALTQASLDHGAEVTLIAGPGVPVLKHDRLHRVDVTSAREMYDAVLQQWEGTDVGVFAAAVSDYRPKHRASEKIKKTNAELNLELEKTDDILAELGSRKGKNQKLIGFALETENELENARKKLKAKNLDLILLNSLRDKGAGFGVDTNKVTFVLPQNKVVKTQLDTKPNLAKKIVGYIAENL